MCKCYFECGVHLLVTSGKFLGFMIRESMSGDRTDVWNKGWKIVHQIQHIKPDCLLLLSAETLWDFHCFLFYRDISLKIEVLPVFFHYAL